MQTDDPDRIRVGACCPIALDWFEPRLGLKTLSKYSLQYYFTQANIKVVEPYFYDDFRQVPSWFVRGVCEALTKSWQSYKNGKARKPRYKRSLDAPVSLSYGDAKKLPITPIEGVNVGGMPRDATINVPKIGKVEVDWLWHRWGNKPAATMRLVKTPNGWHIHLCGDKEFPDPKTRTAAITLTSSDSDLTLATDDRGNSYTVLPVRHTDRAVDPHGIIAKLDVEIHKLQQQVSRQRMRFVSDRQNDVSSNKGNRLAKNIKKLAKLQARRTAIFRSSRQKVAHFLTERSQSISHETIRAKRISKPEPKLTPSSFDPAKYEHNGAEAIAAINRARARVGVGEFIALLKQGMAEREKPIVVKTINRKKSKKKR
jgi:hypothetical protein